MKNKTMTVKELGSVLEKIVPLSLQEPWDNSGFNIAFEESEVKNVLTCLEIDDAVITEAKDKRCNVIITHHPLIFSGVKSIESGTPSGRLIMRILDNGISVYSSHTPFDKVKGGNNDTLANLIGLTSIKNLEGEDVASPEKMAERASEADIGRIGKLKKAMSLEDVMLALCDSLNLRQAQLRVTKQLNSQIKTVGICTGAGADFIEKAAAAGCELFITGDIKYHEAQMAVAMGMNLIDAGHYGTEKIFAKAMQEKLKKELNDSIDVYASEVDLNPFL